MVRKYPCDGKVLVVKENQQGAMGKGRFKNKATSEKRQRINLYMAIAHSGKLDFLAKHKEEAMKHLNR